MPTKKPTPRSTPSRYVSLIERTANGGTCALLASSAPDVVEAVTRLLLAHARSVVDLPPEPEHVEAK